MGYYRKVNVNTSLNSCYLNDCDESRKCLIISNNGVSLISLVITIVILIILAAIAIGNGFTKNIAEANFSKMYNEFLEVENAIAQRGYEHKLDADVYPYVNTEKYSETNTITINNITYGEDYYLLKPTDLLELGVSSVEREYVVNYVTGDVVLKEPYYWKDKKVFTKDSLLEADTNNAIISDGEYDEEKGVNKPIVLNGMLPVKYNGSNWVVTSEADKEWYDYSVSPSGGPVRYANVMLLDDTTLKDSTGKSYTNEQIRGMNTENLIGMEVVTEGSMFVWLPRFTYKVEDDGSNSIVYSNLTKDYTANGYIKSPAFYYGEYTGAEDDIETNTGYTAGGKELTGIWISKYQAGYTE